MFAMIEEEQEKEDMRKQIRRRVKSLGTEKTWNKEEVKCPVDHAFRW